MSSESPIFTPVSGMPDYLYKYVSVKRVLEILLTQEVYFSSCGDFNDPFEGQFVFERDLEDINGIKLRAYDPSVSKQQYNEAKKHFNKMELGFFSMAEDWKSYPMWAHYANQHRGCCIRFNFSIFKSNWKKCFPFMFTERVKYIKDPLGYKDAVKHLPHKSDSIYMSKLENWAYEKEWRAVMYKGDYEHYETSQSMLDKRILGHSEFKKMGGSGKTYPLRKGLLDEVILGRNMEYTEKKTVFYAAKKCKAQIQEAKSLKYRVGMELRPFKI